MILLHINEDYNKEGYLIDYIDTDNINDNTTSNIFESLDSFFVEASSTHSNTNCINLFKRLSDASIAIYNRETLNNLLSIKEKSNVEFELKSLYDFEGLCTALEGCLRDAKEVDGLNASGKYTEAYKASEKLINYIYNDFSHIQQLFAIYNNLESIVTVLGDNYLYEIKSELREKVDILKELSLEDDFMEYKEVLLDIKEIVDRLEIKDFLEQFNILGD